MAFAVSQQLNKYYDLYKNIDVTFSKEVASALNFDPKQVFVRAAGGQWPCIIPQRDPEPEKFQLRRTFPTAVKISLLFLTCKAVPLACVERVILLAGALASEDAMPSDLDDFLDDEDDETIEKCLGKIPDWVSKKGKDRKIDIAQWLIEAGRFGVLVQFATPIITPLGEGIISFSWGF